MILDHKAVLNMLTYGVWIFSVQNSAVDGTQQHLCQSVPHPSTKKSDTVVLVPHIYVSIL
jgi:hypothetical protein